MFTGIIERLGRIASQEQAEGGLRLAIEPEADLETPRTGESIAVSGVCLTLEAQSTPRRLNFFLSRETLDRTTLGSAPAGAAVNLERALAVGDRLGGHFVAGHVNTVGAVRRWERRGEAWLLEVTYPAVLAPFVAPKGSIAVDGISLTVVEAQREWFGVAVIPHTAQATALREARAGSRVNLEADMLARYVARALEAGGDPRVAGGGLTRRRLSEAGFE